MFRGMYECVWAMWKPADSTLTVLKNYWSQRALSFEELIRRLDLLVKLPRRPVITAFRQSSANSSEPHPQVINILRSRATIVSIRCFLESGSSEQRNDSMVMCTHYRLCSTLVSAFPGCFDYVLTQLATRSLPMSEDRELSQSSSGKDQSYGFLDIMTYISAVRLQTPSFPKSPLIWYLYVETRF